VKGVETIKEEKTFLRLKLNCSVLRAQHEKSFLFAFSELPNPLSR
jgi:hypothetical protein